MQRGFRFVTGRGGRWCIHGGSNRRGHILAECVGGLIRHRGCGARERSDWIKRDHTRGGIDRVGALAGNRQRCKRAVRRCLRRCGAWVAQSQARKQRRVARRERIPREWRNQLVGVPGTIGHIGNALGFWIHRGCVGGRCNLTCGVGDLIVDRGRLAREIVIWVKGDQTREHIHRICSTRYGHTGGRAVWCGLRCWRTGTESHRGFVEPNQRVGCVVIGEWVDGLIHIEQPGGYVIFGKWCWRRSHGVGEHRTGILAKIVDHLVRHAGGTGKRGQWVEGDRAAGVHRVGANATYGQRGKRAIW